MMKVTPPGRKVQAEILSSILEIISSCKPEKTLLGTAISYNETCKEPGNLSIGWHKLNFVESKAR